ncbi:hypothetical protein [Aureivirga marina]|uniref:hypothetical protein n=1 Tax=Aureivirga marina TaxID=1182451 RepID=UPI0018C902D9|nr:hypothetical protein [Aureivirga marina]
MILLIYLVIAIISAILIYQDLKFRAISAITIPILWIVSLLYRSQILGWFYIDLIWSYCIFLVILLLLFFYVKWKKIESESGVFSGLGYGDILYFIAIIPLFYSRTFLLFLVSGLLFSLLIHSFLKRFQKNKSIPLAGYFSMYLLCLLIFLKKGFGYYNWLTEI